MSTPWRGGSGRTAAMTRHATSPVVSGAIAKAFAAVGANVVAADRKDAQLFSDVIDEESVRTAVAEASAGSGRIDVLVNSAGILNESALVEMDLTTTWTETIAVTSRESSCATGMW
jgi:3-oxoacyl-[acyl-carrier protein] reductase